MTDFTRNWDEDYEALPTDDNYGYEIDNYIRQGRIDVRERLEVDHVLVGSTNDGKHHKVTLPQQSSAPDAIASTGIIYTKEISGKAELFYRDEDGNEVQLTTGGTINISAATPYSPEIGEYRMFSSPTVPAGWLECNGQAISRTVYLNLFNAIGTYYGIGNGTTTFNVPDLRGKFVRGWDHGAGNDPDAASRTNRGDGTTGDNIGTKQADGFKAHTHYHYGDLGLGTEPGGTNFRDGSENSWIVNSSSTGGNETRPENIYVMWCIKY